jgi:hypothetical protein
VDNTLLIFDSRFGRSPLHVLAHDAAADETQRQNAQGVMAVGWWGDHALSAGEDGVVRTWRPACGSPQIAQWRAHSAPISALALSQEHNLALTGADDAKAVLYTLPGEKRRLPCVVGE